MEYSNPNIDLTEFFAAHVINDSYRITVKIKINKIRYISFTKFHILLSKFTNPTPRLSQFLHYFISYTNLYMYMDMFISISKM